MSPKTKAIIKTSAAILAGAAAFAYLPLVSFAVAPQATAWIHMGLAAIHPLLGEALLGGGVLWAVGSAIKKTWTTYFSEKKLEKKIEQVVEQKMTHYKNKEKTQENQNEQIEQNLQKNILDSFDQFKPTYSEVTKKGLKAHNPRLKKNTWKILKDQNQRKAA